MTGTRARRVAVAAVGLLTSVPIAVGFIVSWGALRDSALAAHTAPTAAKLYPLGVDGLIAMALVAALVLRHDRQARRYCLGVLAASTASSLVLNIAHGQGAIIPGKPMSWQLATLVSAQAVAAIGFGCHLLVHVLRAWFPSLGSESASRGAVVRRNSTRSEAKPAQSSSGNAALHETPLAAGAGGATRQRGDSMRQSGNGNPQAATSARHIRRNAAAASAGMGSKTAAILQYRDRVLVEEGREPTSKEIAAATPASERMARKVLAEIRAAEPTSESDNSIAEERQPTAESAKARRPDEPRPTDQADDRAADLAEVS